CALPISVAAPSGSSLGAPASTSVGRPAPGVVGPTPVPGKAASPPASLDESSDGSSASDDPLDSPPAEQPASRLGTSQRSQGARVMFVSMLPLSRLTLPNGGTIRSRPIFPLAVANTYGVPRRDDRAELVLGAVRERTARRPAVLSGGLARVRPAGRLGGASGG